MENMKIDNAQVTSSSVFGLHKPYYGRLNLLSFHGDPARSAWCANSKDKDPYLEVAFGQATTLSGNSYSFENATFLSVFKKIRSTREQENGVFEKFHFGDGLRKVPFSVTVSLFTCGQKANP